MKIIKYKKKKNNIYELELENGEKIDLYEEVILKFNLLLSKDLDLNSKEIINYNRECEVYYKALRLIKSRTRCKKEIKDKLIKEYDIELIDKIINKLETQGYINELFFARSYLNNKIITTTNGPYKIKKELINKGIPVEIIDKVMLDYTDEIQEEKIKKVISRVIKSNRSRGNVMLKRKITTDLRNLGFSSNLISKILLDTDFPNDDVIAKKEYEKLYKRLSRKYSGSELELKIKQKLYQKGLHYE